MARFPSSSGSGGWGRFTIRPRFMGIYRFVLAALVVLFHFGGLSWIVGRIAVFAFYCVSGFLIFQVLDRIYLREAHGVWRFFSNRFVRLFPLYLLYMLLTLAFSQWFGP